MNNCLYEVLSDDVIKTSNSYHPIHIIQLSHLYGFREVHNSPQIDENHTVQQVSADKHM